MGAKPWELELINGWRLRTGGREVRVALRQQRLIAALALLGSRPRPFLAGLLWPESGDAQASGSLRETVWVISRRLPGLMMNDLGRLELAQTVQVDLAGFFRDITPGAAGTAAGGRLETLARAELLPGWYEDWVLREQEDFQARRLTALQALGEHLFAQGETATALDAARAMLGIDALHVQAMRLLLRVHLQEGNQVSALRAYRDFGSRLREEFGVGLPAELSGLVRPLLVPAG